jgi:hypothetical protein
MSLRMGWKSLFVSAGLALTTTTCSNDSAEPRTPTNPTPSQARSSFVGCYTSANTFDFGTLGCGRVTTFGSRAEDSVFQSEIAYQTAFWSGVPATVFAFDECSRDQRNAYAVYADRSIRFGLWLYRELIQRHPDGLPVSGVIAHEFAHQLQNQSGWLTPGIAKPNELEADAFSGYFMGLAKQFAWSFIDSYFQSVFASGDYNFNNPGHHGTPNERLAAARLGFETALGVARTGRPLSYFELHTVFRSGVAQAVSGHLSEDSVGSILNEEQAEEIRAIAMGRSRGRDARVSGDEAYRRSLFPR